MTLHTAREIAARIWCDKEMSHRVMNTALAEAIARILFVFYEDSEEKETL